MSQESKIFYIESVPFETESENSFQIVVLWNSETPRLKEGFILNPFFMEVPNKFGINRAYCKQILSIE